MSAADGAARQEQAVVARTVGRGHTVCEVGEEVARGRGVPVVGDESEAPKACRR